MVLKPRLEVELTPKSSRKQPSSTLWREPITILKKQIRVTLLTQRVEYNSEPLISMIIFLIAHSVQPLFFMRNLQWCGECFPITLKLEFQNYSFQLLLMDSIFKICTERVPLTSTNTSLHLCLYKQRKIKFLEHLLMMYLEKTPKDILDHQKVSYSHWSQK